MNKTELRKLMNRRRGALSAERVLLYSGCIAKHLVARNEYQEATVILAYMSIRSEVDTRFLIERAWQDGKKVAVPVCVNDRLMEFRYLTSLEDLKPGRFGIPEPQEGEAVAFDGSEKFLLLIPGIAYTATGDRLGYGGGYYDRFLKKHVEIPRFMLAYSIQQAEYLPVDEQDVPADVVVTEIGCINTGREKTA
ncbi:MAG: 5-formyltetrahydrofolate cyclo-ligase [Lachnospiraceae bacterium]|nr:5-formyltetrahydrofolate cyclo-ligase [Lachnospiraceae bacterium]